MSWRKQCDRHKWHKKSGMQIIRLHNHRCVIEWVDFSVVKSLCVRKRHCAHEKMWLSNRHFYSAKNINIIKEHFKIWNRLRCQQVECRVNRLIISSGVVETNLNRPSGLWSFDSWLKELLMWLNQPRKIFFSRVKTLNRRKNSCPKMMTLVCTDFEVRNKSWKQWIPSIPNEPRNENLQILSWRYTQNSKV